MKVRHLLKKNPLGINIYVVIFNKFMNMQSLHERLPEMLRQIGLMMKSVGLKGLKPWVRLHRPSEAFYGEIMWQGLSVGGHRKAADHNHEQCWLACYKA